MQAKVPADAKSKTVSGSAGSLELHSQFERATAISSCSLYVTKEEATILVACGAKVEVCNLMGNARKSLTFSSEAEGVPGRMEVFRLNNVLFGIVIGLVQITKVVFPGSDPSDPGSNPGGGFFFVFKV